MSSLVFVKQMGGGVKVSLWRGCHGIIERVVSGGAGISWRLDIIEACSRAYRSRLQCRYTLASPQGFAFNEEVHHFSSTWLSLRFSSWGVVAMAFVEGEVKHVAERSEKKSARRRHGGVK